MNIFYMNFPENNTPDLGSIVFDRYKENLHLIAVDIPKLNNILTLTICKNVYGISNFYFQSGDVAIVDDTQRAFVYNADSDSWTEWDI